MKRTNFHNGIEKALSMGFFVFALLAIGCSQDGNDDTIWLKDLKNPFIGKWESMIPSMGNARMVSEYSTDGTFTSEFPDLPQEQGGGVTYTGAYLVKGNILVTFMSGDGGIGGYTFQAIDNNTISVTEIDEVDETDGSFTFGNTASFTRFPGSTVSNVDQTFTLTNTLTGGTWKETTTPYQAEYQFNVNGSGTVKYGGQPFDIVYSVVHDVGLNKDVLVIFMPAYNTFHPFVFTKTDNTIEVKEITEITMGGQGPSATYDTAVTFIHSN